MKSISRSYDMEVATHLSTISSTLDCLHHVWGSLTVNYCEYIWRLNTWARDLIYVDLFISTYIYYVWLNRLKNVHF